MKIISITPFVNKSNSKPPLWNGIATNLVKRCKMANKKIDFLSN